MLITADQLLCHAIGDYVLQSDWMALEKTSKSKACVAHVLTYALPFLFLTRSPIAFAIIITTHFVIDRWRLARYVVYAKNFLGPMRISRTDDGLLYLETENSLWSDCQATGYHSSRPPWMAVWLMIVADNIFHVVINGTALRWFP
jgi:hypothetical protein